MVMMMVFDIELSTSQLEGAQGGAVASVPDPLPDTSFKSLSLLPHKVASEKRWTADLTKRWTLQDVIQMAAMAARWREGARGGQMTQRDGHKEMDTP